jgi:hypothetical protein
MPPTTPHLPAMVVARRLDCGVYDCIYNGAPSRVQNVSLFGRPPALCAWRPAPWVRRRRPLSAPAARWREPPRSALQKRSTRRNTRYGETLGVAKRSARTLPFSMAKSW